MWQIVPLFNPSLNLFLILLTALIHDFFGQADASVWLSLLVSLGFLLAISAVCLLMLQKGYKIRG
ncbi:MAG: hypothetical protein GXP17_09650 [Gammaproteobacteria bacterium]|nr:hypothetical protein [Gammaproteobacteria bacterium]